MGMPKLADLEDEDEEAAAKPEPQKKALQTFLCPECDYSEDDYKKAPYHMERHRPLGKAIYSKRGKLLSLQCEKGCGRYFTARPHLNGDREENHNMMGELRVHLVMCNGEPPIVKQVEEVKKKEEERPMAKETSDTGIPGCPYHPELTFGSGQARGQHCKNQHPDWKTDPRLNLKLSHNPSASRALTVRRDEGGALSVPSDQAALSAEKLIEQEAKTAAGVRDLVAAYRARATHYTDRAAELEQQAQRMEADVRT